MENLEFITGSYKLVLISRFFMNFVTKQRDKLQL